ncbi:uncharacterized protein LOC112057886 [Bicyclus anynana]|uniref:Uncharacterized protein LOC112057886 n=1 Tax=Bicyclus anynana TaxID=110368 RepID=A0A6J1P8U1_BICAN|nr:uncharacterized protein LOC112057886 [Bicyclus anynana]
MNKDIFHFDTTVIPGLLYLVGHIRDLHCVGLSALYINYVHYNILMGRLDFDIVMPRVKMTAGQWATSGRYGDSGGTADASGSLEIRDLRLVCDTLLTIVPGWPVTIHNINPDLTLGEIRADFQVGWKCLGCETESDISERVNNGLNVVLPGMMDTYKNEINTMLGEAIRWAVNRFW